MNTDWEFIKGWIKDKWYKFNRQLLTLAQGALTVGALAAINVVMDQLNAGAMPEDATAFFTVIGMAVLSAIMQYIRGKLPANAAKNGSDIDNTPCN